jgi:hypothetical protein
MRLKAAQAPPVHSFIELLRLLRRRRRRGKGGGRPVVTGGAALAEHLFALAVEVGAESGDG